jgi:hypothetical protein
MTTGSFPISVFPKIALFSTVEQKTAYFAFLRSTTAPDAELIAGEMKMYGCCFSSAARQLTTPRVGVNVVLVEFSYKQGGRAGTPAAGCADTAESAHARLLLRDTLGRFILFEPVKLDPVPARIANLRPSIVRAWVKAFGRDPPPIWLIMGEGLKDATDCRQLCIEFLRELATASGTLSSQLLAVGTCLPF